MGIDLCVSRIAAVINDASQPAFYAASGYRLSLGFWFGFLLCLLSFGGAWVLVVLDTRADRSVVQLEVPIVKAESEEHDEEEEADEEIRWRDYQKLPRVYWLLAANCALVYMSFMSFMNIGSDFLIKRFRVGTETAGVILVLVQLPTLFLGSALHHRRHRHPVRRLRDRPHRTQVAVL